MGWNRGAFVSACGKSLAVQSGWPGSGAGRPGRMSSSMPRSQAWRGAPWSLASGSTRWLVGWQVASRGRAGGRPGSGRRRAFPRGGLEQGGPAAEAEPLREEAQGREEVAPRAGPSPALPPHVRDAVQHCMQRESEQVQRGQQVDQALAAMPEVALDVIAVARQGFEAFVLDKCEFQDYVNSAL